jgi:hypothetical protein
MLGIELAGGAFIFLLFVVAYTLAVAYSLYSRRGSAISHSPYGKVYSSAPGANRTDARLRGREREIIAWSRGTR